MEQERVTSLPLVERVEPDQRQKLEHDFEVASQRLAEAQAEIALLKNEFQRLPERVLLVGNRFNKALREFNEAKEAKFQATGK